MNCADHALVKCHMRKRMKALDSIFNGDLFSDNLADLTVDVMGIDLKNAKGGGVW